jgi:pimeloyl-ACP methyl ester carboxylesterase
VTPVEDDSYSRLRAASGMERAAFALDVRGYGDSDLPPEMAQPPEKGEPPVRADQAADDVGEALSSSGSDRARKALFEAAWRAQVESNQEIDETTYAAQTGAPADLADSCRGDPVWDPANIDVSTLVIRGSEDVIADRPRSLDHYLTYSDRRQNAFRAVHCFQSRAVE